MFSTIKNYLANQARKPSGLFGRFIAPRVFNRENNQMEQFGLDLMKPIEDDQILEIGFGNGRLISEMVPQIGDGKICGIDISEEMVNLATERNKRWIQKDKVEIQKASISDIPYPKNHFDKVFTANTIYFWPEPETDIQEVKRVLKPEGTFFCALRMKNRMESINPVIKDSPEVFQNLYREEEVRELFEGVEFRDVHLHSRSTDSETVYIASGSK